MSNSYVNSMRREFRKSGLSYDESDFPSRRQNLLHGCGVLLFFAGVIALSFFIDIGPEPPRAELPGSTPENSMVRGIIGLLMLSPLVYLLFLGVTSLARAGAAKTAGLARSLVARLR